MTADSSFGLLLVTLEKSVHGDKRGNLPMEPSS